jgi:hypothetical protein
MPSTRGAPNEDWYHGYHVSWTRQRGTGAPTMSQPTQPKDKGQEAHNQGGLEDNYRWNLVSKQVEIESGLSTMLIDRIFHVSPTHLSL